MTKTKFSNYGYCKAYIRLSGFIPYCKGDLRMFKIMAFSAKRNADKAHRKYFDQVAKEIEGGWKSA